MSGIDRQRVKGSFHRQAGAYDQHATVQKRVVANLLEQVRTETSCPAAVLDVGCGTGSLLTGLHRLYPDARLFGADLAHGMCLTAGNRVATGTFVTADAESLPFAAGTFDLVTSTSTYQWLSTLNHAFAEARRVLAPGGAYIFAFFGERTLFELKDSYRRALLQGGAGEDYTHGFFAPADAARALNDAGFNQCRVYSTLEVDSHPDVPALLKSLKRIGAGNAAPKSSTGLVGRKVMQAMMDIYREQYGTAEGIPATYEVIYGMGRLIG